MLDLEDSVDLFQRESRRLNVEEPDDRQPSQIEHSKYDIEAPTDRVDAFKELSAATNLLWRPLLDLPTGVMETTMYTQSQLVTMAMEAPLFLDRLELISEGYKNGMARKERPCSLTSEERYATGRMIHSHKRSSRER